MIVDLAIAAVLLISGLLAFARGFVHEVLAVAGWVGATIAALAGFPYVAPLAREWIPIRMVADIATGIGVFLVTLVVLSMISHAISRRVKDSGLGALDRSLGFLYGLTRGVVLVALAYMVFAWVTPPGERPEWLRQARALPLIIQSSRLLCGLGPQSVAQACGQVLQRDTGSGFDAERALKSLTEPQPKPAAPDDDSGYKDAERREMDRLIQSTQ